MIELLLTGLPELPPLPCPPVDGSSAANLVYFIGTFLFGGGLSSLVNGFFNVENVKSVLSLENSLNLEIQNKGYLERELTEKDEEIAQLKKEKRYLLDKINGGKPKG